MYQDGDEVDDVFEDVDLEIDEDIYDDPFENANPEDLDDEGLFIIEEEPEEEEEIEYYTPPEEEDPEDDFGIEGEDLTGRDKAYETFNKVETQIVEAYKTLHSQDDIKAFYDGLLMNLDLYFKKFEDEIQPSVSSPETAAPAEPEGGGMDLDDIANM